MPLGSRGGVRDECRPQPESWVGGLGERGKMAVSHGRPGLDFQGGSGLNFLRGWRPGVQLQLQQLPSLDSTKSHKHLVVEDTPPHLGIETGGCTTSWASVSACTVDTAPIHEAESASAQAGPLSIATMQLRNQFHYLVFM